VDKIVIIKEKIKTNTKKSHWLRNAIGFLTIISIIGGLILIYSTIQHNQFEELHTKLNELNDRINRFESWIEDQEENENKSHWVENLTEAKIAHDKALQHWANHKSAKAEENRTIAHDFLDEIPIYTETTEFSYMLIIIIIVIMLSLITLYLFLNRNNYNQ
jgi:predicted PurR-regulated permease PerM